MRYSLRQLEVFLAVAHFENITRAAESLAMSQSAASSSLKELEQQFDVQLFDRVGKRLQLNEQGVLFRPQVEALLAQAAELERAFRKHTGIGDVKVGATMTIGNYLAVEIMSRYMKSNPGSRVELEVANTSTIMRKVLNFELDVGLVEGELQHVDLEVIPWKEDELVVFCAPEHPWAAKQQLTDADLVAADWIIRERGSGTRQGFDRAMFGLLADTHPLLELQHTEAIKRAVEAGMGVGCLSNIALQDAFRRGSLVHLPAPHRDWHRHFYMVLHKHKYRSAGIAEWLRLCWAS
jgi:DNA-binding transcriptional LysR family regulator